MDKEKDLISIIIPIYNAEKVLPRCLDSLLNQTYNKIEIILINDGSKDNSFSVCKEYANRTSNIIVLSQENGGTAKARNAGLNIARGEYIMFVDADDYVKDDICTVLHSTITRTGANCVISGYVAINENGGIIKTKCVKEEKAISGKTSLHEMYCAKNQGIGLVEVWGRLFRHTMWEELRFSEGMYYEDLEIMPTLYYDCKDIIEIPYVGYYYVVYEESASHGKGTDDKRVWDSIAIRERHIDFFEEKNDKELARAIAGRLFDLIITSAQNGWIPNDQIPSVLATFRKHWKQYKNNSNFSVITWLRYETFFLRGKRFFKTYHG